MSRLQVLFLCAAVAVFVTTAALWPAKPTIEEKLLDRFDQELGLIPRFIGAKPALSCGREGNTAPPVFCPGVRKSHLSEEELKLEAREARESGRERPRFLRNLLRAETPEDRVSLLKELEERLEENPNCPELLNDLAVVHLIREGNGEEPAAYAEAFDLLERANKSAAAPPEVLFNRTFVLTSLGLRQEARRSASRLANFGIPDWTQIAFRLLQTERFPIKDDPASRRAQAEVLLGEWGALTVAGDARAAAVKLAKAKDLALTLANESGDLLLVDTIAVIEGTSSAIRKKDLAAGHKIFFEARGQRSYSNCALRTKLEEARSLLSGKSPFVFWILLDRAICDYFDKRYTSANLILDEIHRELNQKSYLALAGRENWITGLVKLRQGRFLEAEAAYKDAIEFFDGLGELCHVAAVTSLRARNFEQLGVPSEAWRFRLKALAHLDSVSDAVRRYDLLEEAGDGALLQSRRDLARSYIDQRLTWAEHAAQLNPELRDLPIFTLLASSSLFHESGDFETAGRCLRRASLLLSELPLEFTTRAQLEFSLAASTASLPSFEPGAMTALTAIDNALAFFRGDALTDGDALFRLDLLWKRAQVNERHGQTSQSLDDLDRALYEVRTLRLRIENFELRTRLQVIARRLAEAKIRLEIDSLKDPWQALSTLESSSNQAIYDLIRLPKDAQAVERAALSAIPGDLQIVRYGSLDDRLLIFSLTRAGLDLKQFPFDRAAALTDAATCREAVLADRPKIENAACTRLADLLLPKALDLEPRRTGRLLIIHDSFTQSVPFSFLIQPGTGQPVAEMFSLSFSLGLPLLLASTRESADFPTDPAFLLVANPTINNNLFPGLSNLASATASAEYFRFKTGMKVIRGDEATKTKVLEELKKADVVLFETHGVLALDAWGTQGLVLATTGRNPRLSESLLTLHDLVQQDLSSLHTVILGACSTRPTTPLGTAESSGLAAIFLARGVPFVVTTSGKVRDSVAAELLRKFTRYLDEGMSAPSAFHSSQRDSIHQSRSEALSFMLYTNQL